jgi:hypothetical protein
VRHQVEPTRRLCLRRRPGYAFVACAPAARPAAERLDTDAWQTGAIEIQTNRELLLELAERVAEGRPLGVEGLAKASLLVSDPASILYREDGAGPLAAAAAGALEALDRGHLTS